MKYINNSSLLLTSIFLSSCNKNNVNMTNKENSQDFISKNYSSISGCLKFVSDENDFYNIISENEEIILNKKLYDLKKISSENIYEKFDATNNTLNYIINLENNNEKLINNSFFIKTKKSLLDDMYSFKNEITFESHYFAKKFQESFKKLNIHSDLSPLLNTLNHSDRSIELYNKKFKTRTKFTIHNNEDFSNIKNFHEFIELHTASFHGKINNDPDLHLMQPTLGLSHAYLIKNIIDYFSNEENNENNSNINSTLNEIIKVHIYTNLVQLSSDVIDSGIKTLHVIEILNSHEMQSIKPFQVFTKISSRVNIGLSFFNVLFDGLELTYAEKNSDIMKYKTQLGIDTATFIVSGFGIYLGETAGIFLSGLGVIFGGLSVGFSGFADAVASVTDQTLSFGKYFLDYKKNHDLVIKGSNFYPDKDETMISLAHKNLTKIGDEIKSDHLDVVIEELDFTQKNKYKIVFGDHLAPPYKEYPGLRDIEFDYESKSYVKIRESLGYYIRSNKSVEFPLNKINKIILPNQAQYLITYQHMLVPGITNRHDAELSSAREIGKNAKFVFDYFPLFGGEKSVGKLNLKSQDTTVNINLNSENNELFFLTPEIPNFSFNKVKYKFNVKYDNLSNINSYHVLLSEGAKYEMNLLKSDEWHLHIKEKLKDVYLNENGTKLNIQYPNKNIKDLSVKFSEKMPSKIYIHDNTGITYVVFSNNESKLLPAHLSQTLNFHHFNNNEELFQKIDQYFNNFEYSINFKGKYLKLINYKNNLSSEIETVFYDIENRNYIYSGINNENIEIIGRINNTYVYRESNKNKIIFKTKDNLISINYDEYFVDKKFYIKKNFSNAFVLYELNENGLNLVETKYSDLETKNLFYRYNRNNNTYNDLNYVFGIFGISDANKANNSIKYMSDNAYIRTKISDIVRLTNDKDGMETKLFYIPSKNIVIDIKDKSSKILDIYKDSVSNNKYFFISGENKSKIIKMQENGNIEEKDFNFSISKVVKNDKSFLLETKNGYIYSYGINDKYLLVGLSQNWFEKNLNNNLMSSLEKINLNSGVIKLFLNNAESADYYIKEKKIVITKNNKIPLGESKHHHDRYYFHDLISNKNYYIKDTSYFIPQNYKIIKSGNSITLKYESLFINWYEAEDNNDIIVHKIDKNKKMALFMNHFFK